MFSFQKSLKLLVGYVIFIIHEWTAHRMLCTGCIHTIILVTNNPISYQWYFSQKVKQKQINTFHDLKGMPQHL